ncbi:MAG: glycosyltransferase family 2 protein [Planctomycetes bacterium]|nr:glycosyltransferase family 2 protein [Planctomycetota bacterium]
MPRFLTALPVFNEAAHVDGVLDEVLRHVSDVLVVDDGSTDGTSDLLAARVARRGDIRVVRHAGNRGYGVALATAFRETVDGPWDGLVTIDCDGQHQPQLIPQFIAACTDPAVPADIVSGSRYFRRLPGDSLPPAARRRINAEVTAEINDRLGLTLSDAFCGFKAYSRRALERLRVTEPGYAMPLEVWVQAAAAGLAVVELPVPLVYLDLARSFGGALDDAATRLAYYRHVLDRAEAAVAAAAGGPDASV